MEVRNQHHTLATELPVPIEQRAALSPGSVWMFGKKLCVFYPLGVEPWFIIILAHSAVTVSLELSQSHLQIFLIFVGIGHIFSQILFPSYGMVKLWLIKMCCIVLLIHWINACVFHTQKLHPLKKFGYFRPAVMLKDVRLKFFT